MARRIVILTLLLFLILAGYAYFKIVIAANASRFAFRSLHKQIEKEYGFTVGMTGLTHDSDDTPIFNIQYISKKPLNWLEGVKAYKTLSALYIEAANQKPKLLAEYGIKEFTPKNLEMWISNYVLDATIPLNQRCYYLDGIAVKQEVGSVDLINKELKLWMGRCSRKTLLEAADRTDITDYSFLKPDPSNVNSPPITQNPVYIRYYEMGLAHQKKKK